MMVTGGIHVYRLEAPKGVYLNGEHATIVKKRSGETVPAVPFTIKAEGVEVEVDSIAFSIDGGAFVPVLPTGVTLSGNVITVNPSLIEFKSLSIRAMAADPMYQDVFTLSVVEDAIADEELMADINESLAITDNFGTTTEGGLVTAVMILLREFNSTQNTAGFSGIQGEQRDQPSYWSGGTHPQAQAFVTFVKKLENDQATTLIEYENLPSVVFLHNGAAKVGDFIVESTGRIVMIDPAKGEKRLMFGTSNIPTVEELNAALSPSGSFNVGAGTTSSSLVLPGSTNVTRAGAIATFDGVDLSLSAGGKVQNNGFASSVQVEIYVRRNGSRLFAIASNSLAFASQNYTVDSKTVITPRVQVQLHQSGTYTLELVITTVGDISSPSASSSSSVFSWKYNTVGVKRFEFNIDGFMSWFTNNAMHFSEEKGLYVKGAVDMPGVQLSASVQANGGFTSSWGKTHASLTATRNSVGRYTVYHAIGHSNYHVNATPLSASRSCHIVSKGTTSFVIEWRTIGSSPALSDTAFDVLVTGNNLN